MSISFYNADALVLKNELKMKIDFVRQYNEGYGK